MICLSNVLRNLNEIASSFGLAMTAKQQTDCFVLRPRNDTRTVIANGVKQSHKKRVKHSHEKKNKVSYRLLRPADSQ